MRPLLFLSLSLALVPGLAQEKEAPEGTPVPDAAAMERLAGRNPVEFLEASLRHYDEVRGYTALLHKQERIGGELRPSEEIAVSFREKPFSVLLVWKKGEGRAASVLYVRGENDDQLLVLPAGALAQRLAGVVRRDPNGPDARASGRYPLTEFGMRLGTRRVLASWQAARKAGTLHVECLGIKPIFEAGGRPCLILRRTRFTRPEDGVTMATLYFDTKTWLQVGTVLKGEGNRLVGEYFFRDVHLNPDFPPGTFTRQSLEP
jgi:hypothetical protein